MWYYSGINRGEIAMQLNESQQSMVEKMIDIMENQGDGHEFTKMIIELAKQGISFHDYVKEVKPELLKG